jgi:hypothetical protein
VAAFYSLFVPSFEETMMMNDLPPVLTSTDAALEAYNAAFYELGLHRHWDRETYAALLSHSREPQARIRHYVETRQPHLLTAYDAAFLAAAIHERVLRYKPCAHRRFDWAKAAACEIGV